MANVWKSTTPLKKEPKLSEIMSEQLIQRLQIEDDYVWVDLPEVQPVKEVPPLESQSDDVSPDLLSIIEASIAQNFGKIVQSEVAVNVNIGDEEDTDKVYYDDDTDIYDTNDREELDEVDDWECKIDNGLAVKAMYSMPQWLKHKEHGRARVSNSDNKNQKQNNNDAKLSLPKIKFDVLTTALLERLIKSRYIGQYGDVIGRGKNSVAFYAHRHRNNCVTMPFETAVKVYKLSTNVEKNKMLFKRAQREHEHLKMVWHGFYNKTYACPLMPVCAWKNIIVMAFTNKENAPSIQDLPFVEDADTSLYLNIVRFMYRCYNVLHLVHGKLCAQNIRRYSYKCLHFMGWGHSVKSDHPRALIKLIKDCQFVSEFYSKRGVKVKSTEDLFKEITGCTEISSKLLEVINGRDLYDIYDRNPNRMICSSEQPNKNLRFKCN